MFSPLFYCMDELGNRMRWKSRPRASQSSPQENVGLGEGHKMHILVKVNPMKNPQQLAMLWIFRY